VVRPNGDLVIVFSQDRRDSYLGLPDQPHQVMAIRSTDAGASWSAPVLVATVPPGSSEVDDPGTGDCVRTGGDCPTNHLADGLAVAGEPDGTIDAVWQQDETDASGAIMLSRSADGVHWSTPRAAVRLGTQVFLPAVVANGKGRLALSYYAFRPYAKGAPTVDTDVWLTTSTDHGQSFAAPTRLAGPFDIRSAPASTTESVGRFLGDYDGLVALPDGFGADFAASAPLAREGASDVFFSHFVTAPKHHRKHKHRHRHRHRHR
jgi:hypothetical protein